MKLNDFNMQDINIALDDQPVKMGKWKPGSRSSLIGVGQIGSKKYQVKIHAGEPKWYLTDQKISAKKDEIRVCPADDFETKTRLESELNSLQNNKAKNDEKDHIAEEYLNYKKRLITAIKSVRDPLLICPEDFWKEPIEMKGNGVFSAEAVSWVDNVAVGFDPSSPIVFNRDLDKNTQYKILASFAERLANLHKAGVVHGDLKEGNTLIVKEGGEYKVALIDFDAAIILNDLRGNKVPFASWFYILGGTYFSNETYLLFDITNESQDPDMFATFDKTLVNEKADIFAMGITMYEYFYGRVDMGTIMPFKSPDGEALDVPLYGVAVAQDYKPDFPDTMDELLYGALNWMLAKEPADRPTAKQVHDVFATQDMSLIPSKYTRNPLWPEDQATYKLVATANVSVSKGSSPHRYRVKIGATTFNRTIQDLVKDHYVERLDGVEEPGPDINIPMDIDKTWDGSKQLPKCVTRASTQGLYTLYVSGFSKTVKEDYLVSEGILCAPGDEKKPWPCDKGLTFISPKPITRDFGKFRGPGHYKVGTGVAAIPYTKKRLLDQNLAREEGNITFTLFPRDAADYVPNPAGIPSNVTSVTRDTITGKAYRIKYADGRIEKLMPDAMLSRGFIKRK